MQVMILFSNYSNENFGLNLHDCYENNAKNHYINSR